MEREEKQREVTKQDIYNFMQPGTPLAFSGSGGYTGLAGGQMLTGGFVSANAMYVPLSKKPMFGLLDEMKELNHMAGAQQDALVYILSNMHPSLLPAELPRTVPTIESDGLVGDYFRVIADIRTKMEYNLSVINALIGLLCGTKDEGKK